MVSLFQDKWFAAFFLQSWFLEMVVPRLNLLSFHLLAYGQQNTASGAWGGRPHAPQSTGGTPAAYVQLVVHQLDYCCIGVANAAQDTSIANLLHWRSQCSTVRCLHLTVNLQWKLFIFTPKRSFGWKCSLVYQLFFLKRKVGQKKSTRISGLTPWDAFHISGLTAWDVYAFRALRPEMQKRK